MHVREREKSRAIVSRERDAAVDAVDHQEVEIAVAIDIARDQAADELVAPGARESARGRDVGESARAVVSINGECFRPGAAAVALGTAVAAVHIRAKRMGDDEVHVAVLFEIGVHDLERRNRRDWLV